MGESLDVSDTAERSEEPQAPLVASARRVTPLTSRGQIYLETLMIMV